jgi:hypothetical protein
MPTDFLTDDQFAQYGRFCGAPSRAQLERYFFLDDADRALIARRRRPHMQLGFALQLGTVRFLGIFLPDPLDVPHEVIAYVAAQLGIDDLADLPAYTARKMTPYAHTWEIRHVYGYHAYSEAEPDLRAFLAARLDVHRGAVCPLCTRDRLAFQPQDPPAWRHHADQAGRRCARRGRRTPLAPTCRRCRRRWPRAA